MLQYLMLENIQNIIFHFQFIDLGLGYLEFETIII